MVNTDLIRKFEGCRLEAYKDAVGVLTVGYGHTGPDVHDGQVITQEQADSLLQQDVERFAIGVQNTLARPATQGQHDALVSFAFNVGLGAFKASTLLARFNAGDFLGAAEQFTEWDEASGTILQGLVRRRTAELIRFLGASSGS